MGTLYHLYTYKIAGPYPKTRRELVEMQLDENGEPEHKDTVAMITVLDRLPGESCGVTQLQERIDERRSA